MATWTHRYIAYCLVHHVEPGEKQQRIDFKRWGHRNLGVLLWDGLNRMWTPQEIEVRNGRLYY
jgi:hypothetical protein